MPPAKDGGMEINMICCLAVDPAYRKRGIASLLLREALDKLDRDKDITVSTFRENDVKGRIENET